MKESFSFRQRLEIAPSGRLPFDGRVADLHASDEAVVQLRSLEDKPISGSRTIAIWGRGFPSEAAARAAGDLWRSRVQRALAGIGIGANFGIRNPQVNGPTDALLESMSEKSGEPLYRDSWAILVFPSEPEPSFGMLTGEVYITPHNTAVDASFAASRDESWVVNEVAFDLYTASMRSAHLADVRLVLLVMAFESLIEPKERPIQSVDYLNGLAEATSTAGDLDPNERVALANALRSLRHESIAKAAKRVASQLNADDYPDDSVALVSEAFKMRHLLVHGGRRPDLERVRYVGASLERLVGDLIAGPVIVSRVSAARKLVGSGGQEPWANTA